MLTASIVLYKTPESELETVLNDLLDSIIDFIYLIDNSPTDSLKYFIKNLKSNKLIYIFGQGNVGYGVGNNIAIKKAIDLGVKYHIVLNSDLRIPKGTIEELYTFMENHDRVGMCMPKILNPKGEVQHLCHLHPTPLDVFVRRLLPSTFFKNRRLKYTMVQTGYQNIRRIPQLSGCFMFLRIDILLRIGLFDDRYFMYFEDFDLMRRIDKCSCNVYYPLVSITHNHRAEHRLNKKLLKISIISAIKYFNKWGWLFDSYRRVSNSKAFDPTNIIYNKVNL